MKKLFTLLSINLVIISCASNTNKFHIELNSEKSFTKTAKEDYDIKESGIIKCFPEGKKKKILKDNEEKEVEASCELSAVQFYKNTLIFGNDKTFLDQEISPIFSVPYKDETPEINSITYYKNPKFYSTKKFEDFSITLDKKYIFATTSFDRDDKNFEYNSVLFWQPNRSNEADFLTVLEENKESRDIKKYIQRELNNSKYFKEEGLTIIPEDKIIFGIREEGESYKNFNYTFKLISASLVYMNSKYYLKNDFKLIYNFTNSKNYTSENVGISGLAWDNYNKRILILTSFEEKENIGAYLWSLDLNQLKKNAEPNLIYNHNLPLKFEHKAEGVTVIDKNQIFIISDDDRIIKTSNIKNSSYSRKPNESIYDLIEKMN